MLKVKLKDVLEFYGFSLYDLANALLEDDSLSESTLYRFARGGQNLTLRKLEAIVGAVRRMTRSDINVADLISFEPDPPPTQGAGRGGVEPTGADALVPVTAPGEAGDFDEVWRIVLEKTRGRPQGEREARRPRVEPEPPGRASRWRALSLVLLFVGVVEGLLLVGGVDLGSLGGGAGDIATPLQVAPEGTILALTPKLRVNPLKGADGYEFSVFNLNSHVNILNENTDEPFFIVPPGTLCPNVPYGWKAKAVRGGEWSSWSSGMEFMMASEDDTLYGFHHADELSPPTLPEALAPTGTITTLTPTLEVSRVSNATGYGFFIRDLTNDTVFIFKPSTGSNAFTVPEGVLERGGRYRWNANARNCAGFTQGYTEVMYFDVATRPSDQASR